MLIFFPKSVCRNFFHFKVKWSAPAVTLIRTLQLSGCSESLDSITADALLLIFSPFLTTYKKSKELQIKYTNLRLESHRDVIGILETIFSLKHLLLFLFLTKWTLIHQNRTIMWFCRAHNEATNNSLHASNSNIIRTLLLLPSSEPRETSKCFLFLVCLPVTGFLPLPPT